MADHLPLPPPVPLTDGKRREGFDTSEKVFDARGHATTLRGILEGLESSTPGLFAEDTGADEADGIDAANLGRYVLKFTGRSPFTTSGLGEWEDKLVKLGFSHDKAFYALSDADSRAFLRSLVDGYDSDPENFKPEKSSWLAALNNIANVELYGREDRAAPDLHAPPAGHTTLVDVSIWPTSVATRGAEKVAKERLDEVAGLVTSSSSDAVQVLVRDASDPDRIFLRARVDDTTLEALLDHPLVERVRGPLTVEVSSDDLAIAPRPEREIIPAGAPIGIIDDEVADANPWMNGVVVARRSFPDDGTMGTPTTHGTYVAGIAAWGRVADLLSGSVDRAPHPIYSARVAHGNAAGQAELAGEPTQQIEAALRWLASENVRVVVFAFAHWYADDGALPADLSATIDTLAKELNLVVVVSAGNLNALPEGTHWKTHYPHYLAEPYARVAAPGTAALALTVGSAAHSGDVDLNRFPSAVNITSAGQAAPFSRTGPTASGRQKPEFSGHGGSWAWNHDTDDLLRDDPNIGAVTLRPVTGGRLFTAVAGTSFAAPHVANEVAQIATRYPTAGANLLRALTALSAEPPNAMPTVQHAAYGIPRAANVLESGGPRAIMVHEGTINGASYQVIELPVPDEFASGSWDRELRVAVAFDPEVRRSRRDYISCHIDVEFIRNVSLEDIKRIYRTQPSLKQREEHSLEFVELPSGHDRPPLRPGAQSIGADTVFCRTYRTRGGSWNVDDQTYFLIVTHSYSPWTDSQKKAYPTQDYAVAVEFLAHDRPELDLHALTAARLAARARPRARS